jgi:uncharacterized protein (TIGR02246 family)
VDPSVDKDKDKKSTKLTSAEAQPSGSSEMTPEMEELYRRMQSGPRGRKAGPDPVAAALEAAESVAALPGMENSEDPASNARAICRQCGHRNREGNRFCAACGTAMGQVKLGDPVEPRWPRAIALGPNNPYLDPEPPPEPEAPHPSAAVQARPQPVAGRPPGQETHHYHHHYHYFPGSNGAAPRGAENAERVRPSSLRADPAQTGAMSRAEAAVRRLTQDWAVACNTKHLDDMLELYTPDAIVMRSNCPPVRGAAAVREFFFGAIDAGLGEVEVEPLRVEVAGDMAYETGRCKALVPGSTGKRREERGKYLWVCTKQANGEWRITADCWASDLTLPGLESEVLPGPPKTTSGRKNS